MPSPASALPFLLCDCPALAPLLCSEKDPKAVFIGRVNKLEGRRKVPAVEMQFVDDMQKYWWAGLVC